MGRLMTKKKKRKVDTGSGQALKHNPFADLAHLKDNLPAGPRSNEDAAAEVSASEPVTPASNAMLLVRLEKRAKGKRMTCIYHVETDREALLKQLKKRFATGGTDEESVLCLQGDHREAVAAFLSDQGYKVRVG